MLAIKGIGLGVDRRVAVEGLAFVNVERVAAREGCNYFTFNIPNTICNDCGHIDKRFLKECPECHSHNIDYLTRIIGYLKRVSNFSEPRQEEAARRYYGKMEMDRC